MIYLLIFRDKGRGGERERVREREKQQSERETSIGCLPNAPGPGIKPET